MNCNDVGPYEVLTWYEPHRDVVGVRFTEDGKPKRGFLVYFSGEFIKQNLWSIPEGGQYPVQGLEVRSDSSAMVIYFPTDPETNKTVSPS